MGRRVEDGDDIRKEQAWSDKAGDNSGVRDVPIGDNYGMIMTIIKTGREHVSQLLFPRAVNHTARLHVLCH